MKGPQVIVTHVAGSSLVGTQVELNQELIRFGRHPENDVTFDPKLDVAVSSFHAEMFLKDGAWLLRDLGSRNGTFVNSMRISSPVVVPSDAKIRFGDAGPQVVVSFGTTGSKPNSGFVGQRTLVHAIDQVVERERTNARRRMVVLASAGLLLTVTVAYMLWTAQRNLRGQQEEIASRVAQTSESLETSKAALEQELAPIGERLRNIHRQHDAAESDLQRLTLSIASQQEIIDEIQSREGLTEPERQLLLEQANAKLEELSARLERTQSVLRSSSLETNWPVIVEPYLRSIFLCYYDNGTTFGIGTAFAIDESGILATNAHVVAAMKTKKLQLMIENGTGTIFLVQETKVHPEYDGTANCPDIALVKVDTKGQKLVPVRLADEEDLRRLRIGSHLGTLGFPGELLYQYSAGIELRKMRSTTAVATFKDGWVGQITDFSLKPADWEQSVFIQHSASVSHGTSGSPLFNTQGKVVAINNSGKDIEFLGSHDENGRKSIARSAHPAEISRGIRIDVLQKFREQVGW